MAAVGDKATVTLTAVGNEPLTYKWYYADPAAPTSYTLAPDNTNVYQVNVSSTRNGRTVYCVVSDRFGNSVTSDTVTLTAAG